MYKHAYELYRSENNEPYHLLQTLTGTTTDSYGLNIDSTYKYQIEGIWQNSLVNLCCLTRIYPFSLPENLTTFDNTTQSTLMLPNELKVGDTYYRFNFVQKSSGGFGEIRLQQTSTDDITYGNDKVVLSYTDHPDLANSKFEGINILYHAPTNKFAFGLTMKTVQTTRLPGYRWLQPRLEKTLHFTKAFGRKETNPGISPFQR